MAELMYFRSCKLWTEEELKLLKRDYGNVPTIELIKKLGRSMKAIHGKARKCGFVFYRRRKSNREYTLASNYNLTLNEYNNLVELQNGTCAICGKVETMANQFGLCPLSVDHNHSTGKVRGLLCSRCNLILGNAKDDIEVLENAIKYLKDS